MNASQAIEKAYAETESVLESAGLNNGHSADRSGICFYPYNRLTIADTNCSTFVTYSLVSVDNRGRADSFVYAQYVTMLIEIWTVKEPTSAEILSLIDGIGTNAEKLGYSVEVDTSATYNYNTTNNHISLALRKLMK